MKNPSKEQVEVYKMLSDMYLKLIFGLIVIIAFIVLIVMACVSDDWKKTASFLGGDALLGRILFVAFKHYFPSNMQQEEKKDNEGTVQ